MHPTHIDPALCLLAMRGERVGGPGEGPLPPMPPDAYPPNSVALDDPPDPELVDVLERIATDLEDVRTAGRAIAALLGALLLAAVLTAAIIYRAAHG